MPEQEKISPNNHAKRKHLLTVFSIVFLLIGLICGLYWVFWGRFYETTDDAYVNGNLIRVMPQISGQVTAILADETDLVKKGNPIVLLNKVDADINFKNAEIHLALTVRHVSQLYQNVDALEAGVVQQEAVLKKAQNDYLRRKQLKVGKVITQEDLEHARLAANSAAAALEFKRHQRNAVVALIANSDLYHHPKIQQAAMQLRQAYLALQRTTIYAPETGYVAKRSVQVGAQVNPSTVLMIVVPLNQIWVDANFKEPQLRNIRIGQPVDLISDLYGTNVVYQGKVIGLNPGAGDSFALLPPQNATGNWIKVVQRLPVRITFMSEQLSEYPLRIGLSMTATVDTYQHAGEVLSLIPQKTILYQTKDYSAEDLKSIDLLIERILKENVLPVNG